jgi:hypothetical protein
MTRKLHRQNTAGSGVVLDRERAAVSFDVALGNRKPQTQSAPVGAALRKGREHGLGGPCAELPAVVFDFDEDVVTGRVGVQHDLRVRPAELEGVLQQVRERREEPVSVALDRKSRQQTILGLHRRTQFATPPARERD